MLMPVAMVIGVIEWLPWSLLLGIVGRGYFDASVCLNMWVKDDKSMYTL